MNILAPVNTMESAIAVIDAGCNEIYLSGDKGLFKTYSFSGRGKIGENGICVANNFENIRKIVGYAHEHSVKVNFTANIQYFTKANINGKSLEKYYLEYVENAIAAGVDSIIVGDIGLLKLLAKQNYGVSIHASIFFKTINREQVLYLKENGADRVTLSYQITADEIELLSRDKIMEYEVVGYAGCSFFNGACNFLHGYGEGVIDNFNPGISCKSYYKVAGKEDEVRLFDAEASCAVCSLKKLEAMNVDALKLVGRDKDYRVFLEIIKYYKDVLHSETGNLDLESKPIWWERLFCRNHSCKYKSQNSNYAFTIGR